MTDPRETLKDLRHTLHDIPEAKFVEIVRLLEQVGDLPEVRDTFDSIRPRLAQVRPARRPTLKRIFCDPFEDVLEAVRISDVPVGRVERSAIDPLWRVVEQRGDPKQLAAMEQTVRRLDGHDGRGRHTLGCRLWYVAGTTLRTALAEAEKDVAVLRDLFDGDPERVRQAQDIADFQDLGHLIAQTKAALPPRPIPALDADSVAVIGEAVREAAKQGPMKPMFLLLVVASRMRKPADLLSALGDVDFGKAHRHKPAIIAQLSGLVVTALENRSHRLEGMDALAHDPTAAVDLAEQMMQSLESTLSVMGTLNETAYDERLDGVRQAVGGMVSSTVIAPAPAAVASSLPKLPPRGQDPQPPDDAAQSRAEDHIRALRRCQTFAAPLGLEPAVADTLKTIGETVEKQATVLMNGLDRVPRTDDSLISMEQALFYTVRMLELAAGPAPADALRIKAMEAMDDAFDGLSG